MPRWLEVSLDYGISEWDFWDMTLAEINRAIESKQRIKKRQDEEKAELQEVVDFLRDPDLIGKSVARIYASSARMPELAEAYPTLFSKKNIEEEKQRKKDELSAIRFKQFAAAYNARYKDGEGV